MSQKSNPCSASATKRLYYRYKLELLHYFLLQTFLILPSCSFHFGSQTLKDGMVCSFSRLFLTCDTSSNNELHHREEGRTPTTKMSVFYHFEQSHSRETLSTFFDCTKPAKSYSMKLHLGPRTIVYLFCILGHWTYASRVPTCIHITVRKPRRLRKSLRPASQ